MRDIKVQNLIFTIIGISVSIIYFYDFHIELVYIWGVFLMTLLFLVREEKNSLIKNIYIRPVHLFILSYSIVFFQKPIDFFLGYDYTFLSLGALWTMPKCLEISVAGLAFFFLGYLNCKDKSPTHDSINIFFTKSPRFFAFLTSLFMVLILVTTPTEILRGGYSSDLNSGGLLYNYLSSWCNVFVIAFFIQKVLISRKYKNIDITLKEYIKEVGIWQNSNLAIYSLIILNIGDRGPLIIFSLAYFISYIAMAKKCPSKKLMIVLTLLATLFFSFLGKTKSARDNNTIVERISATIQNESEKEDEEAYTFLPATSELAGSYKCLAFSLMNVPSKEDFEYGRHQLSYILNTIPFSSSIIRLGVAPTTKRVTEFIQGPDATYGNGTSCNADFYLDGGIFGVIISLYLFGYAMRKFEYILICHKRPTLFAFTVAFYFCCHVIYFARSNILGSLKYSIWTFLLIYLYNYSSIRKEINKKS